MRINFGAQATPARANRAGAGGCVNFIREVIGEDLTLYRRPGFSSVASFGTGGHRSALEAEGSAFIVVGNALYKMDSSYNETFLGNLQTLSGHVSMSWDGQYLVLVDGAYLYVYNDTGASFTRVTNASAPTAPTHTVFSDGYHFLINGTNGEIYTHENAYDPAGDWNSLTFATAEYAPDRLKSIVADKGVIFLIGEDTIEPWEYDGSSSALPLTPVRAGYSEYGIVAEWSATKFDNSVVFLSRDNHGRGVMVRMNGWTPQIISTPELHAEWASYSEMSDAFSQVWWYEGHSMLILTFPSADKTWVYDSSQPVGLQWSEWQRGEDNPLLRGRMRMQWSLNLAGTIIFGDYEDATIHAIDRDTHTDNGTQMHWSARSTEIKNENEAELAHRQIQVFMEGGVGLTDEDDQGYAPVIYMRYSDDHGYTWLEQREREFGRIGEYAKRVRWNQLGQSRHRIYEIYGTEPVETVVTGGSLNVG